MIASIGLQDFKNFSSARLSLGPLSLLVGTNASGKSNLRDAFRFLHGISRGYTLPEIIGEKWIEGGVLQWRGIRGGTREVSFDGSPWYTVSASFNVQDQGQTRNCAYLIQIHVDRNGSAPTVVQETLEDGEEAYGPYVFSSIPQIIRNTSPPPTAPPDARHLSVRVFKRAQGRNPSLLALNNQPVLTQLADHTKVQPAVRSVIRAAIQAFSSMRFLDLSPEAMRLPSVPGQAILGDRGENLSSVLQAICQDPAMASALKTWVRELTPMDATGFDFVPDASGKILLHLVEENGRRTSALSASDGTLRFLAMIAAFLGPEPAKLYFIEELENGIHPTRLGLLLQLIEQQVEAGQIQVVATTHSPLLLSLLSEKSLQHASLVYRLPDRRDAKIKRILDIPDAAEIIRKQSLARLQASGWLEDAVYFLDESDQGTEAAPT